MKINNDLGEKLLSQTFDTDNDMAHEIQRYRMIAAGYAYTENSIAVLSDLKEGISYIYYGGCAGTLGLGKAGTNETISSIWEKNIFNIVQPSDLDKRNLDELKFFHFIKGLHKSESRAYYLHSYVRMNTIHGIFPVSHRVFYVASKINGSVRLALCIYNIVSEYIPESYIYNTLTGSRFVIDRQKLNDILTKREKDILTLIERGKLSKEIAGELSISINTVNRHRQNILEKLRAQNSFEACRTARLLNLLYV